MDADEDQRRARFSQMYARLHGRVEAYAARRVGAEAAADVTAETFLVAWRRIDALPLEPLPWLYGVARHIVLRHRAEHAREIAKHHALAAERIAIEPTQDADLSLWEAWNRLSTMDREVLSLVAWEQLRVRDAAQVLGCSPAVFSVRLHRARRRFEQHLEHSNPPSPHTISPVSEAR